MTAHPVALVRTARTLATVAVAMCPAPVIWRTPQRTGFNGYPTVVDRPKGYTAQLRLLDGAGAVLVLRTTDFPEPTPTDVSQGVTPDPGRHVANQQTRHAILASLRFGQAP